jgi:hypothetical protein
MKKIPSTAFNLSSIGSFSLRGSTIHFFIILEPIGVICLVENIDQRNSAILLGIHQLKVAYGKFIQPYIFFLGNSGYGGNVFDLIVFCFFQVKQNCPCRNYPMFKVFYRKTF